MKQKTNKETNSNSNFWGHLKYFSLQISESKNNIKSIIKWLNKINKIKSMFLILICYMKRMYVIGKNFPILKIELNTKINVKFFS